MLLSNFFPRAYASVPEITTSPSLLRGVPFIFPGILPVPSPVVVPLPKQYGS